MNYRKAGIAFILVIFLFLIIAGVLYFLKDYIANYAAVTDMEEIEQPGKDSRLLVIAPHNDDETLGASMLIKRTLTNGGLVKVVLMTNGDGFKSAVKFDYLNLYPKPEDYIRFGYQRQRESLRALKLVGVDERDVIFLGYPDAGLAYLWSSNWDPDNPLIGLYTQTKHSPYRDSFTKEVPYTGQNVAADLTKIILNYKPTHIMYPHPHDRHPDHWATNAFVKYVLTVNGFKPQKEWLYLVHRSEWPTPLRRNPGLYLAPPAKLLHTGTDWRALYLDHDEEDLKIRAINSYRTQIDILGMLLTAFERKNELIGLYGNATIEKLKNNDAEIVPTEKNKIIIDPIRDELNLEVFKSADIANVYAEVSRNKNLHFFIEMDSDIKKHIAYNLNLVLISGNRTSRLNLVIRNGRVTSRHVSRESVENITGITAETKDKMIHVTIPYSVTGDFKHMYVNIITSVADHIIDRSAWRMTDY